ncbi:hypothetical protein Leryth_012726 [Lithospermum erythrorhizon]|nr:hypothetical protein Leryth_012726 [Lithospermum erythrorhizon]
MEKTRNDEGYGEQQPDATWWPTDLVEKFESVSLGQRKDSLRNRFPIDDNDYDGLSCHVASRILWTTGVLREPIPNGFYSVVPDKKLKELFENLPSLDELQTLDLEGITSDIILVDATKDKKISMLKQLIVALVKGLNSHPAAMIKKIAGLVCDFYKRPNSELSPAKAALDTSVSDSRSVQLLGQIKHGSCRPRAILFKVLADTVGLESRLVVGLPTEGVSEYVDSDKHMSVFVVLNSAEMLVDLKRFPGQLIPRSTKAIFLTHISAGESDSAENDSCDSPLEPNSPLYGYTERADPESTEKDDALHFQRRLESSSNAAGPSLRNMMLRSSTFVERKLSPSLSEPDIANNFWRRSRRKSINEPRTASSSPEHPSFRAHGRSMLSVDSKSLKDSPGDVASTRTSGASASDAKRIRRRSISITPEIGDDIVRAVRAMNETLKQNRLLGEDNRLNSYTSSNRNVVSDYQNDLDDHDEVSDEKASLYIRPREHLTSQKAISLPSSPHQYSSQSPDRTGISEDMVSTWNNVLKSHVFQDNQLLPFDEWNIEFSELTVGTRVGIGFFGEVFRGIWNGTDVAIKVFLEQDLTAENMMDFCNEISILSRLRHPNVILFLGACTKPPRLSMITEYMEMGSLYYLVHVSGQKIKLSWRRRLKMLRDICR